MRYFVTFPSGDKQTLNLTEGENGLTARPQGPATVIAGLSGVRMLECRCSASTRLLG